MYVFIVQHIREPTLGTGGDAMSWEQKHLDSWKWMGCHAQHHLYWQILKGDFAMRYLNRKLAQGHTVHSIWHKCWANEISLNPRSGKGLFFDTSSSSISIFSWTTSVSLLFPPIQWTIASQSPPRAACCYIQWSLLSTGLPPPCHTFFPLVYRTFLSHGCHSASGSATFQCLG